MLQLHPMRAALALSVLLAALTVCARATASDGETCGEAVRAWAAACTAAGPGRVDAFRCPAGHAVFAVVLDDAPPVFVDASAQGPALRRVGGAWLSPLGEFADFQVAPPGVRGAFERVVECVERDPSIPLGEPPPPRDPPRTPGLLIAGLALACVAGVRLRSPRSRALRAAAVLVALGAVTLALARGISGEAFFHQNGHGPNWIGYALGAPCPYGPGYPELFGWLARLRPDAPEALVFAFDALLAAACPALAWVVARRVGAKRPVAWAIAAAVALDPLLWRMAFSESYYVAYTALPLVASAALLSAPALRTWAPRFLAASAAAGLILAQLARVHPVGWSAIAVIPLTAFARRGSSRRNAKHAAIALATVGLVVAVTSWRALQGVLRGELGARVEQWRLGPSDDLRWGAAVLAAAAVACFLVPRLRGRPLPRVALLAVVGAAAGLGTSLLRVDVPWIHAAHAHAFLASFVGAGAGVASAVARTAGGARRAAAVVAALAVANTATHWRSAADLPTDALELRLALGWRTSLPAGSRLVAVETSGVAAVDLPFYAAPIERLEVHGTPPALTSFGDRVYYYRSSLCSTASARPWCDSLEGTAALEPVVVHDLPARPSTLATTYDAAIVRVGLYRVSPRP